VARSWVVLAVVAACTPAAPARPAAPASVLAALEARPDLSGVPLGRDHARATIVVVFASWCPHCHDELDVLAELRQAHPAMRVVGLNYEGHEDYDGRGSSDAVRHYVADHAPWLRVVPCDEACFAMIGRPTLIPTTFVYDQAGALVETFDRRERPQPTRDELVALLHRLGA